MGDGSWSLRVCACVVLPVLFVQSMPLCLSMCPHMQGCSEVKLLFQARRHKTAWRAGASQQMPHTRRLTSLRRRGNIVRHLPVLMSFEPCPALREHVLCQLEDWLKGSAGALRCPRCLCCPCRRLTHATRMVAARPRCPLVDEGAGARLRH